jgi:hypothetical protein
MYGIASPAPICPEPGAADDAECQVVQAPMSPPGRRLVPETDLGDRQRGMYPGRPVGPDDEIRLTYRELTALIEDAVKSLK